MNAEEFFKESQIVDLSFFNFRNAITAAYFADNDLKIRQVNENFTKFFPVLGNVTNISFLDVLTQLGVPKDQIDAFEEGLEKDGQVLIPAVHITIDGEEKIYSLLSTKTYDGVFSYLNGVQGQFVDRTAEWALRHEREELLEQKVKDRELIEEKSQQLEALALRLAKYLSPQIYESIFSGGQDVNSAISRKGLTVFFSDIEKFTDLSDSLEPERLASIVNSYLSEMASIAIDCGGTIDKFIGDAVMVFFGDPESFGEQEDALKCMEMAIRMQERVQELQRHWRKLGAPNDIRVRMGVTSGYCTVGNFGSQQRLDYTILGSPVNLAARLQALAPANGILVSESTYNLIREFVRCDPFDEITPKGFARPVQIYQAKDFLSEDHRAQRQRFSIHGTHVEVNVFDSSDIQAAITELRRIQENFERQLRETAEETAAE